MSNVNLLKMYDEDGEYIFNAKEVAEHHRMTEQAVFASRRKKESRLDMVMIFDLVAEEKGISVKKDGKWRLQAKHVAKHNKVFPNAVYQARLRDNEVLDKIMFLYLMKNHFLKNGVCGEEWMAQAYIDSGISDSGFCIKAGE